jgi:hypothetical protein
MSRSSFLKIVSALLLLLSVLPAQQALAGNPGDAVCTASDATSLEACVGALTSYDGVTGLTTEIMITAMIPCAGSRACEIDLTGTQAPPSAIITGDPSQSPSAVGLHRIANYGYTLINILGWSNVTLSNFTVYDDPSDTSVSVDGSSGALFCGTPAANSVRGGEVIQGTTIASGDTGVSCPVPGYVVTYAPDNTGTSEYYDSNAECFNATAGHVCPGTIIIDNYTNSSGIVLSSPSNITMSGMLIEHSQTDAISVSSVTKFYFLNNNVSNAYYRGLTVSGTDMSIEGNTFFANRAAGLRATVLSSSARRPSDVSGNIFDHNQHGDAFPCGGHEGCSGGQIGLDAGSADFVFSNNTFINGYMDFYDPNVFEETYGMDGFSQCDLSQRCYYYSPSPNQPTLPGESLTTAGDMWLNGGGVNSDPSYAHGTDTGPHANPEVEITGALSGNNVIFANNIFDYGNFALFYDTPGTSMGTLQAYDNEIFQNSGGNFFNITSAEISEVDDCYTHACGSTSNALPEIIAEGPTTAAAERSICGDVNCLWVTATQAWSQAYNSLALGSSGAATQCALQIYGPGGGTLLATVKNGDAACTSDEGVFTIPASVAQHYTSVQIAYENINTGLSSAKQLVTLAGMTPAITGTGATTCSGSPCVWVNATDAAAGRGNCAVGIYNPTTLALITTLTGALVTCASTQATFFVPASISNTYSSIVVNYQNLVQGTWSKLATVTLSTGGGSGGGGGGGGTGGCGTVTTCQQQ